MLAGRGRLAIFATSVAAAVALVPAVLVPAVLMPATAVAATAAPAVPADSYRDSQAWVLDMLHLPAAWQVTEGKGVLVAVLDSGVNPDVSDLFGSVIGGPDLTGLRTPTSNKYWGDHGTWMASIIAGHGHGFDNDDGIIGVAPEAKILSIRVIPDKSDPGYRKYDSEPEQQIQDSLAAGIRDAVRRGAQVISMSIGYSSPSAVVRAAIEYAYLHGVVLVASSGNSGQDDESRDHGYAPVSFPADYPGVLSVAALNRAGHAAAFSSNNLSVQVAAPGVKVPAQGRDGQYWTVDGTSPACALVAGVAALIKARYPRLSPELVDEALTTTARNPGHAGYNVRTGFGTVNAAAALTAARRLAKPHAAGSQVAPAAKFGGGPSAVPAAPVSPRGVGMLVLFAVLALISFAVALAAGGWLVVLRRQGTQTHGGHAAYAGPYAAGYTAHGTDYSAQDDAWRQ